MQTPINDFANLNVVQFGANRRELRLLAGVRDHPARVHNQPIPHVRGRSTGLLGEDDDGIEERFRVRPDRARLLASFAFHDGRRA